MNCKHVQELLPLYVGRDLEGNYAQLVTAHMQSCAECAGLADAYRETRQLLQRFTPPQFGEAVYDGIRQQVLREIGREATAPSLSRMLENLFRPRFRWAVATALLLAVSVLAFYFVATRRTNQINDRQQLVASRPTVAVPISSSMKGAEGLSIASTVKNKGTHKSQRSKGAQVTRDRARPATVNSADAASMTAATSLELNSLAEPPTASALDSATSGKVLRVEMQTSDPNIRIIWFTPQPAKQDSPNKFSKGT